MHVSEVCLQSLALVLGRDDELIEAALVVRPYRLDGDELHQRCHVHGAETLRVDGGALLNVP